jgi:hypothetical protein
LVTGKLIFRFEAIEELTALALKWAQLKGFIC